MKQQTVDALMESLSTTFAVSVHNNQKLMAFELALKDALPEVEAAYRKHLEKVQESARSMPLGLFEDLRSKLLQD